MEEKKLKKIEEKNLPWFYKLILKVPGTGFLENAGGVFWGILVPIFLVAEFFLSFYLVLLFPFPINIILTSIIPTCIFIIFVKISLKRFISWWNATFGESFEWNVEKALDEYIDFLKTKKKNN